MAYFKMNSKAILLTALLLSACTSSKDVVVNTFYGMRRLKDQNIAQFLPLQRYGEMRDFIFDVRVMSEGHILPQYKENAILLAGPNRIATLAEHVKVIKNRAFIEGNTGLWYNSTRNLPQLKLYFDLNFSLENGQVPSSLKYVPIKSVKFACKNSQQQSNSSDFMKAYLEKPYPLNGFWILPVDIELNSASLPSVCS